MRSSPRRSGLLSCYPLIPASRAGSGSHPEAGFTNALRAFTLIELLVVVAIISILTAILFPVFVQARRKAYQAQCATNMKQIGLAVLQYQQDFDGHFVPCDVPYPANATSQPGYFNGGKAEWLKSSVAPPGEHYLLLPYIKNDDVRLCPTRKERDDNGGAWSEGRYTMNGQFFYNYFVPRGEVISRHDSEVAMPATTMLVWEHYWNSPYCGQHLPMPGQPHMTNDEKHWESAHHGGLNVLWADGHVKRHSYTQLTRPMTTVAADPI